MTAFDHLLQARRSIRQYASNVPEDSVIRSMLEAAVYAPSPSHGQPVRFIRIASEQIRHALADAMSSGHQQLLDRAASKEKGRKLINRINAYWRFTSFMFEAPVLLAVTTENSSGGFSSILHDALLLDADPYTSRGRQLAVGSALQNVLLKGTELGLSGCILTAPLVFLHEASPLKEFGKEELQCFLTIGHAAEEPKSIQRYAIDDMYRVV